MNVIYYRNNYKCGKALESCRCVGLSGQQIARLLYSHRKSFAQKLSVFAELNYKDITYVYTTNCEYREKQLIISCCYFVIIKSTLRFFLEFFSQRNVNKKGS
jgi:hypothetical protein